MNRECHGDYFSIDDTKFYRCFYDGEIFEYEENHAGDYCKNCKRKIYAKFHGRLPSRDVVLITTEVKLPNGWTPVSSKEFVSQK